MKTAPVFFSQPLRPLVFMLAALALAGAGVFLGRAPIEAVFRANLLLNGFILGVFALGVLTCFWQVAQLSASVRWIKAFLAGRADQGRAPRLLGPLAALLAPMGAPVALSASSLRSILDSVESRVEEARDITRYLANLLIFLGLLGTFYGLATTVPAMVDTIRSLAPAEGESGTQSFARLMEGLQGQLGGMGTAFSSSLLGLAGSLMIGLLELFAGHGQNRFYRELEEWLSSITQIGLAGAGEGEAQGASALWAALRELAQGQKVLQAGFAAAQSESLGRAEAQAALTAAVTRLAAGQDKLLAALAGPDSPASGDAESRMRLRSIDVQLLKITDELAAGREELLALLRAELAALRGGAARPGGRG